jgi:hypothetical protein
MYAWFGCRDADDERGGRLIVPTVFFGALVVSLAVVLAVGGLALVRRLVPLPLRQAHNTSTATICHTRKSENPIGMPNMT